MNKEEIRYSDGRIEHPGVRHEPTDIRFGWILMLIIAACCVVAVQLFLIWKFYGWQRSAQEEIKKTPYRLAPMTSTQLPPEPRLEQLERMAKEESANVFKQLAAREKMLDSYGATSEKGFVHIPIRLAIKAIAGELPVEKKPAKQGTHEAGLIDAGESNSGRMFRGEPL